MLNGKLVKAIPWYSANFNLLRAHRCKTHVMRHVKSFRSLEVYQLSKSLSKEIFELTKKFPRDEAFSLVSQIRRSSRSVGAQLAEAWAKRKYEKYFVSKLTDADGEQLETQHWIEVALDCGYISSENGTKILNEYAIVGRMLHAMITKAPTFCHGNTLSSGEAQ